MECASVLIPNCNTSGYRQIFKTSLDGGNDLLQEPRKYYSGVSIRLMMAITEHLGRCRFDHYRPGVYRARLEGDPPDWQRLSADIHRRALSSREEQDNADVSSTSSSEPTDTSQEDEVVSD